MKLVKLLAARSAISKCAGERLPATIAYKFARFLRLTDGDESFYHEKFKVILDSYAKKDESGNFIHEGGRGIALKPECIEVCQKEIAELENMEIEMPFSFTLDEIGNLSLSIKDCFDLDELIKGEQECPLI